MSKENYVEPMVVDKNGNIYYSAKVINELDDEKQQENKRLNNIIKEVREKINKTLNINSDYVDYDFGTELLRQELLEILDKENK